MEAPNESEDVTIDLIGNIVDDFDITAYGFSDTEADFNLFTGEILNRVQSDFDAVPLASSSSINFEIGDIGTAPSSDSEYYFVQIGTYEGYDSASDLTNGNGILSTGTAGQALVGLARNSIGESNPFNRPQEELNNNAISSVFTNHIDSILDPETNYTQVNGLSQEEAVVNAIANTLSHEIGHTLNLEHVYNEESVTPNSLPPIMGTGALDFSTFSDFLSDQEFSTFAYGEVEPDTSESVIEAHSLLIRIGEDVPLEAFPADAPTVNNVALLQGAIEGTTASVPFEFSPGMGLFLVGGTWGFATLRKKSRLTK